MPLDFYYMGVSAPCRAVHLTAKAVGVELNMKEINLFAKEQMKPEFVAINPQHCVPTLVDEDLVLWESRAICSYLASQYGKDDTLYPKEPKVRAKVDMLLYFDMGTLYHRFGQYVYPVIFQDNTPDPDNLTKVQEALGWLDGFLSGHKWAVGDSISVADHCLAATVSTIKAAGIDLGKHDSVSAWYALCEADMPGFAELNNPGAEKFGGMFKSKTA